MEIKKQEYQDHLQEEYVSVREACELLGVSEEDLRDLIKRHQVPTHNVAGAFTRLKKSEIEALKNKWRIDRELFPRAQKDARRHEAVQKATLAEKLRDFWYFNDFYILCAALIAALIGVILSSQ